MKQVKRRVWSILLACVMLLTMLPAGVWAAGSGLPELNEEGIIQLTEETVLTENYTVNAGETITIDLNGNTLDVGSHCITVKGTLRIEDETGSGQIKGSSYIVKVNTNAELNLLGGNIVSTGSTAIQLMYRQGATFTMAGGSVSAAGSTVQAMMGTVTVTGGRITTSSEKSYDYAINSNYGQTAITIGAEEGSDDAIYVQSIRGYKNAAYPLLIYSGTIGRLGIAINEDDVLNGRFETDFGNLLPGGKICAKGEDGYYYVKELQEGDAAAKVGDVFYASLKSAAEAMKNGDTLTLLKDYEGADTISINAYGTTVDLNGCSIKNTAGKAALEIYPKYSVKPTDNDLSTTISNSKSNQAVIAGTPALFVETGNSTYVIDLQITGAVLLQAEGENVQTISLGNARLKYSEDAAKAVSNGGFKAETEEGFYIYGSAYDAVKYDKNHTAVLLNPYNGNDKLASSDKTAVIDLNGYTFESSALNIISPNAENISLTIKNGTVHSTILGDENSSVSGACVMYDGVTLNLDQVNIIMDSDNVAVVTIGTNKGITISMTGGSLQTKNTTALYFPSPDSSLTIDGTKITSEGTGVAVKGGTVVIKGDTIIRAAGEKKAPAENNSGSTETGDAVYLEGNYGFDMSVSIEAGKFFSENGYAVQGAFLKDNQQLSITGGYFNTDPVNFVDSGYSVLPGDISGYDYMVVQNINLSGTDIVPDVADPEVDDNALDADMTENEITDLKNAAKTAKLSGMNAVVQNMAEDITETDVALAKEKLIESVASAGDKTVTLYVQTYLYIKPKSYNSETKVLKLDVTPMVQVIASTAATADEIVTEEDVTSEKPQNAVVYREAEPLQLDKQDVTVTIQLPNSFMTDGTAYVVHTKGDNTQYLYDGQVANNVLTFTNPNGFSDFTVYGTDPAVARVYASAETEGQTGTGYMTLQQAVDNVPKDGYIVVKQDGKATVRNIITFTVKEETGVASISAGRGYKMTTVEKGDGSVTYTFSRRSSSSNSGSTGGIGTRLPVADEGSTPSVTGFESDTNADLTVNGRYQFRITSLDGHTPVLTVNNSNFTVTLASQSGRDYFYVITCSGAAGSTAAVSVDGKYLLTATVGGSASGVVSDTTHPFTVAQGGTYQFRLTAAARPSFAAGSASFTVEYAGQEGNDWFYKVHAVGQVGDGCGFYINGEAQPVAVATIG